MKRRLLELLGVAAATVAVAVLLQLTPVSVEGQEPATTPWGHPDLEGIWLDVYSTPLERAPGIGEREFATEEERAARDQAALARPPILPSGAYNTVYTSARPAGPRTSLVVDPPDGRIPALTPEQVRRNEIEQEWRLMLLRNTETCRTQAPQCAGGEYGPPSPRRYETTPYYNTRGRMNRHDGPEDQSLGDRCMSGRTPDLNGFRRIVQGENAVSIAYDTGQGQGFQRLVNLGGNHPPGHIRLRHGDSRGRWEGRTLVIETTNFSHKFPYQGSAENRRLVERYTRVDEDTLDYEMTIEDPTVWVAPWTIRQELKRQSDEQNRIYYEPRCHEGNYGLPALLLGYRLDDRAFAEGRGPDPASFSIYDADRLQR